jgi:hypothetical protein
VPPYSFTLRDGVTVRDIGTEELPSDEEARAVARETVRSFGNKPSFLRFRVVVENEIGTIICDLAFSDLSKPDVSQA